SIADTAVCLCPNGVLGLGPRVRGLAPPFIGGGGADRRNRQPDRGVRREPAASPFSYAPAGVGGEPRRCRGEPPCRGGSESSPRSASSCPRRFSRASGQHSPFSTSEGEGWLPLKAPPGCRWSGTSARPETWSLGSISTG